MNTESEESKELMIALSVACPQLEALVKNKQLTGFIIANSISRLLDAYNKFTQVKKH